MNIDFFNTWTSWNTAPTPTVTTTTTNVIPYNLVTVFNNGQMNWLNPQRYNLLIGGRWDPVNQVWYTVDGRQIRPSLPEWTIYFGDASPSFLNVLFPGGKTWNDTFGWMTTTFFQTWQPTHVYMPAPPPIIVYDPPKYIYNPPTTTWNTVVPPNSNPNNLTPNNQMINYITPGTGGQGGSTSVYTVQNPDGTTRQVTAEEFARLQQSGGGQVVNGFGGQGGGSTSTYTIQNPDGTTRQVSAEEFARLQQSGGGQVISGYGGQGGGSTSVYTVQNPDGTTRQVSAEEFARLQSSGGQVVNGFGGQGGGSTSTYTIQNPDGTTRQVSAAEFAQFQSRG